MQGIIKKNITKSQPAELKLTGISDEAFQFESILVHVTIP